MATCANSTLITDIEELLEQQIIDWMLDVKNNMGLLNNIDYHIHYKMDINYVKNINYDYKYFLNFNKLVFHDHNIQDLKVNLL